VNVAGQLLAGDHGPQFVITHGNPARGRVDGCLLLRRRPFVCADVCQCVRAHLRGDEAAGILCPGTGAGQEYNDRGKAHINPEVHRTASIRFRAGLWYLRDDPAGTSETILRPGVGDDLGPVCAVLLSAALGCCLHLPPDRR